VDKRSEPITRALFIDYLRDALNHLYNADQLRKNPLAVILGVADRFESSTTLRKSLLEAIDSFRPSSEEPVDSHTWRIYDSLFCCYVQQLSQQIVADQLCISTRQLRREQHAALEALADYLWHHFDIQAKLINRQTGRLATEGSASLVSELSWLKDVQLDQPTYLYSELRAVLELTRQLEMDYDVQLMNRVPDSLPALAIHPVVLNQILLNLVSAAIHQGTGGRVVISARELRWSVEMQVQVNAFPSNIRPYIEDSTTNLDIAMQLVNLTCGTLVESKVLPCRDKLPVLVIDDNADTLQLFRRYTSGTRYHLEYTPDVDRVMELVEEYHPQIILLDIMMPKDNGWIVLGRLRQHPLTSDIPVIICTILPQEKLALSLGASAFLKKPVSRQDFLSALDQLCASKEPESY
jgi:CheY-like chemotaxis protein